MNYTKKKKGFTILKEITSHPLVAGVLVVIVLSILVTLKDRYWDKPSNNEVSIEKMWRAMDDLTYLVEDLSEQLENYNSTMISTNETIKKDKEETKKDIGRLSNENREYDKRLSVLEALWNGK